MCVAECDKMGPRVNSTEVYKMHTALLCFVLFGLQVDSYKMIYSY